MENGTQDVPRDEKNWNQTHTKIKKKNADTEITNYYRELNQPFFWNMCSIYQPLIF